EQILQDRRSRSQAFFSSAAGQWDRMRDELYGRRLDTWAMAALLDPNAIVGDLGCGTGSMAGWLSPWVRKVIGVDSSAAMLQAARRRLKDLTNVELRRGELDALPLADQELTHALMVLVLPYVENPEAVLRQAARSTCRGGRLVLVDMQL
ncbi:MAG: class I SAM-dependent methyltransferase, partial [Pirellulaceae bacterium]